MTVQELQRIVLRLANQMPTRYWLMWLAKDNVSTMAIEFHFPRTGIDYRPLRQELEQLGFEMNIRDSGNFHELWTIARTEEEQVAP